MANTIINNASEVPLATFPRLTSDDNDNIERSVPFTYDDDEANIPPDDLPPQDHGRKAYSLLGVAFVFEALMWGFPLSFGVFQEYYSRDPVLGGSGFVAVVGTVASGLCYLGAPVSIFLLRYTSQKVQRWMIWFGWALCILSLCLSSLARTLPTIILTQGVLYGLGFVIFYYPILALVNEYWVARRGFAYGILCAASGVSGIVFPFTLTALLNRFGAPTTLRAVAIGLGIITGPMLPLLKGRTPPRISQTDDTTTNTTNNNSETQAPARQSTNWSFLSHPLFWIYTLANILQGLGYFFPALFLPTYASALSLSPNTGALLLALMSIAQVLGQTTFGWLSDRPSRLTFLSLISTVVSAAVVFGLWGPARNVPMLCVFAILYGFFGAGYTALWGRMGTQVAGREGDSAFVAFGLFNAGKGLGNVLAGPISGGLLMGSVEGGGFGLRRYKGVVVFAGACMAGSAVVGGWAMLRGVKAGRRASE